MSPRPRTTTRASVTFFDAYPHVFGGAQRAVLDLAVDARERGWEPRFVAPAEGPVPDRFRQAGVEVEIVAAPAALGHFGHSTTGRRAAAAAAWLPVYWRRLAKVLRGAAVVHVDDPRGLVLAGPAARLARVPFVWHVHVVSPNRWLNRLGARLAAATVSVSDTALEAMPELAAGAEVEPNPVPEWARSAPVVRPGDVPVAVTVARFHPDKGLDLLVRAWPDVVRAVPGARLRILGAGQAGSEAYEADVMASIEALGVGGSVECRGWVESLADHWHDATAYVQPSRRESFAIATVEAMACGLPAVVTDIAGLGERVRPGETGFRVPPEDPPALAGAVARLLADPDLAARLGKAAREDALAGRRRDDYADSWVARYRRLTDSSR